jgi:hypothetical protein
MAAVLAGSELRTSLFAFDLDSKWPRNFSYISRSSLLLRSRGPVPDSFAIQKCLRHFVLERKVHVLRNVPREPSHAHGIELPLTIPMR